MVEETESRHKNVPEFGKSPLKWPASDPLTPPERKVIYTRTLIARKEPGLGLSKRVRMRETSTRSLRSAVY